ncbi:ATP-binding protein [Roseateles toxinivorans]|uniref:ATP-binding protein n=1 Tax=Roseateles toxinivorans TaxID=270368 RepID=UPI00105F2DDE|nr:ATP-binding protein [Roseateles toxinivorans]
MALGILLPVLLLGRFLLVDRYEREVNLRVRVPMSQYTDMLSRALVVPLWNVDKEVASRFVQAVMRNPEVVRVTVEDESRNRFVHSEVLDRRSGTVLKDERPIILENRAIGLVTVELSTERVDQELRTDLLKLGAALLGQVGISFLLILLLFERRIMRPVLALRRATERLANGELREPVAWEREDEIGKLAQSLELMRQELARLIADRDVKNAELQQELNDRLRAEQALRSTEAKFTAIFQASPVAMKVLRKEQGYAVVDVNEAWERQFTATRAQVLSPEHRGRGLALWQDPADQQAVLDIIEHNGEVRGYEAWLHCGQHKRAILCDISGQLVDLGRETLIILVLEDITQKRHNEQEVLKLNTRLEQRVQERTQALETANKDLTAALENLQLAQSELIRTEKMAALGSLVAGIAHELNTPIGNAVMIASTLQHHGKELAEGAEKGLRRSVLDNFISNTRTGTDILMKNLSRASELVASFKQVAVDQTSVNRRMFALDETVAEIVLTMGPTIRRYGHQVLCQIPPKIIMDSYPGPLGQVLSNLINNAFIHAFDAKFKGTVTISARVTTPNVVELEVRDNGRGIAAEHLERIFDPFFTTKLGQGGSGLGLNIVYNLVTDVLGGSITVKSQPGEGCSFYLKLPQVVPVQAAPAELEQA